MFLLTANITIKSKKTWIFDKVAAVEIERDSESLTDTCKITLPKKVKWQNEAGNPLKRGDAVTVAMGYDGDNTVVFRGYISKISAKVPVVITCEDEMWILKKTPAVKNAYKSASLETLLNDQNTGLKINVFGEQNLGAYRVNENTVAELLAKLKDNGIRSFFRYGNDGTPVLYSGVLFQEYRERVQVFDDRKNMIDASGLDVQSAADVKLKVKAISLEATNKKTVVEVGDSDGETRTLHAYGKTEPELKAWAEQELKRLKRDGLVGSFDTLGAFLVDKLDVIGIVLDGEKKGLYQVAKNTITYDTQNGFRQNIELGDRVDGKTELA